MGFEPMKNGFAIRPLSPLGHAAELGSALYHLVRGWQRLHVLGRPGRYSPSPEHRLATRCPRPAQPYKGPSPDRGLAAVRPLNPPSPTAGQPLPGPARCPLTRSRAGLCLTAGPARPHPTDDPDPLTARASAARSGFPSRGPGGSGRVSRRRTAVASRFRDRLRSPDPPGAAAPPAGRLYRRPPSVTAAPSHPGSVRNPSQRNISSPADRAQSGSHPLSSSRSR